MDEERKRRFVETVQEKRHMMWRVACRLLCSPADAEDAVSAAVEACYKHLNRLRDLDALPAYLMRSTINAAKGELRRRRHTTSLEPLKDNLAAPAADNGVAGYVDGLKEKYRVLILLRYGEDLPEKEIAEILHLPRGTVSSRLSRALDTLRKDMEKEESGHAGK